MATTILVSNLGAKRGPELSKFQAYAALGYSDYDPSKGYYVQRRRYLLFSPAGGSGGASGFGGSTFTRNWGDSFKVYGYDNKPNGIYGDSGWVNVGWKLPGETVELIATCGYTSSSGTKYSSSVTITATMPTVKPDAPTDCTNTRNSDSKNTVSWTLGDNAATYYANVMVERSVDGGAWSQIESLSGTATSYADTTASPNHSYAYRVRAWNVAGYSGYETSGTTYNTPAAPTSVTAARTDENSVAITIVNPAKTATALELQRSADGVAWENMPAISGVVTETSDSPGGGTFYYRARNTRGSLASDWSPASNAVVTICPPNAPTLTSPASGSAVSKADSEVTFAWLHNAADGSAQTAAKLRWSINKGSTWNEVSIDGGAAYCAIENSFAINSEVTWAVCTKGAHNDFGPWSDNRVFLVCHQPSVAFEQPSDGFVVGALPIRIKLQYIDESGVLANAVLSVSDGSKVVYTRDMGTSTECEISASDWLPSNGESYTISVNARSSSTLIASAVREIAVRFTPPQPADLKIVNDPETGYVSIVAAVADFDAVLGEDSLGDFALGGGFSEAIGISVYRVYDGERIVIGEDLRIGSSLVDRYAPLNVDYTYEAITFAESGAINRVEFDAFMKTSWSFIYFKDGLARGRWNPSHEYNVQHAYERIWTAGRKHPIGVSRDEVDESHAVTVMLMDRDEERAFRKMMYACEPVVAKIWRGDVFHAFVKIEGRPKSGTAAYWGEINVTLPRIDGDPL